MKESRQEIIHRLSPMVVKYVVFAGDDTVVIVDSATMSEIMDRRSSGENYLPNDKFLAKGQKGYVASYMDHGAHMTAKDLTECHAYKFLAGMRYGRDRKNKPRFKGQIYRGRVR